MRIQERLWEVMSSFKKEEKFILWDLDAGEELLGKY